MCAKTFKHCTEPSSRRLRQSSSLEQALAKGQSDLIPLPSRKVVIQHKSRQPQKRRGEALARDEWCDTKAGPGLLATCSHESIVRHVHDTCCLCIRCGPEAYSRLWNLADDENYILTLQARAWVGPSFCVASQVHMI